MIIDMFESLTAEMLTVKTSEHLQSRVMMWEGEAVIIIIADVSHQHVVGLLLKKKRGKNVL